MLHRRGGSRHLLTRRGLLEQGLHVGREPHDVVGRAGPEDEAVTGVLEARLHLGVLDPQEEGVYDELLVVRGDELLFLLLVPLRSMSLVESLNLCLKEGGMEVTFIRHSLFLSASKR